MIVSVFLVLLHVCLSIVLFFIIADKFLQNLRYSKQLDNFLFINML